MTPPVDQPNASRLQELERENAQLKLRLTLSEEVDAIIERCNQEHKNLRYSLEMIFAFLEKTLHPVAVFMQTQDEELSLSTFVWGMDEEQIRESAPAVFGVDQDTMIRADGRAWFVIPLDMAGEIVGTFGMAFAEPLQNKNGEIFAQLRSVAEELDNYFHSIHQSRYKHMTIIEIQRCLKQRILSDALTMAISILGDMVPFQQLVLLYLDEDLSGQKIVQYLVYQDYQKKFDSNENPMPELEDLIREGKQIVSAGNRDLEKIFSITDMTETILLDGLVVETLVGKMLVKPPQGVGFSVASRELIQVFSESLRQRLVDFNREKNMLRQFFPPATIRKLLAHPDYRKRFLSAHQENIGILYADISGFTKMSEQILKDPEAITTFVNDWSRGVVDSLFAHGGTLDKLVGDCIIGLFGPPFYELTDPQIAQHVLRAADEVREFTREFLRSPQNKVLHEHPLFNDLGVAIGVNFCPANVGLIGPNQDLTAFSSGMNKTARLQGVATCNEILLMPSIKALIEESGQAGWSFLGPFSAKVKNVKDPLPYFKLEGLPADA